MKKLNLSKLCSICKKKSKKIYIIMKTYYNIQFDTIRPLKEKIIMNVCPDCLVKRNYKIILDRIKIRFRNMNKDFIQKTNRTNKTGKHCCYCDCCKKSIKSGSQSIWIMITDINKNIYVKLYALCNKCKKKSLKEKIIIKRIPLITFKDEAFKDDKIK